MREPERAMVGYAARIWDCRHFWLALTAADLRARYRGSMLGIGWSLANPLAMTLLVTFVFSEAFGVDPWRLAPHVLVGLSAWKYLTACVLGGCQAFRQAEGYIRQAPLPLAIHTLRVTLASGFHLAVALAAAWVLACVIGTSEGLWSVGWLIFAWAWALLLGWALSTLAAFAAVPFADGPHVLEVAFQFLFYLTPVIYPPALLADNGRAWLVDLNPLHHYLELFRRPLTEGAWPAAASFVMMATLTALACVLASAAIATRERQLIFQL